MLGSASGYRLLWVPTVLALVWFARWRHLVVYLTTLSVVAVVAQALFGDASLPRAVRSTLTGSTQGYVVPTWPVTVFSAVATATVYVGELRPSSWREAVDLANMMLTLALPAGTARVYDRAVRIFDPHEVAEAFAASGSVTIPRQLRRLVAVGGSDLVAGFRALAPHHPPIAIQRWSVRRVRLALLTVAVVAGAFVLLVANLRAGQLL